MIEISVTNNIKEKLKKENLKIGKYKPRLGYTDRSYFPPCQFTHSSRSQPLKQCEKSLFHQHKVFSRHG